MAAAVRRLRDGDRSAFVEVMRHFDGLVRAVVSRHFSGELDREEAIQDIWIHVWQQRAALDADRLGSFPGWLTVVARHRCVDALRHTKQRAALVERAARAAEVAQPAVPAPDPAEVRELTAAVQRFADSLDGPWRKFFSLHFVEGLDYGEIAQRLSISRLRCKYMKKVLVRRARRRADLMAALGRVAKTGEIS